MNKIEFNENDVRTYFRFIHRPGYGKTVLMVKLLDGSTVQGFFDNEDSFVEACRKYNVQGLIWAGINPIKDEVAEKYPEAFNTLGKIGFRGEEKDIAFLTTIPIDIDPTRLDMKEASTEAEKMHAFEVAKKIFDEYPVQLLADSGNGYHIYFRLNEMEIEDREKTKAYIRYFVQGLRNCINDQLNEVHGTFPLNQLMKVPGTMAVKGSNTFERPWRLSKILEIRDGYCPPEFVETIFNPENKIIYPENGINSKNKADKTYFDRFIPSDLGITPLEYQELLDKHENDRSRADMAAARILKLKGFSNDHIFNALRYLSDKVQSMAPDRAEEYLQWTVSKLKENPVSQVCTRERYVGEIGNGKEASSVNYIIKERLALCLETPSKSILSTAKEIVSRFLTRMEMDGVYVSSQEAEYLIILAAVLLEGPAANPIICSLRPGLGKSRFIEAFLSFCLETGIDLGAVVVKERQEDIDALANNLGYGSREKSRSAYPMKGFDKDCAAGFKKYEFSQCRNCRIKECRVKTHYLEQKAYPVVIISHQRLFMHSEFNSDLHEFETWVDEKGVVRKRQLLLIDEKPVFTVTDCVDSNRLNGLLNEVKALESRFKAEGLASEVEGAKNVLEKVMDDFKEPGIGYFDPQERFRFSKEFKSIWKIHGSEWFHRLPEIVEYLINEGGVVERTIQHHVKLLCSHKVEVAWENYKTVIFDGTSDIDRSYTDEYRYLPGIEPVQYPNLTLNVCNRGNLSRTGIKRRDVNHFIDKLSADCASLILSRPEDRFYIVSYKEHESAFRASLRSKLGDEPYSRVEMDHFGNTKGKNDRRDCTCIILLGLLHKGESHYVAKYSSVYGRAGDLTVNNIRHSRKFIDPHLSQFIRLEQVAELAQEIYRTAIRRHGTRNVDVFLFSRDNELVEDLKAYFPGCKDGEWKALNSCPGAKGAMDLIDILKTELVEKGRQTITKRELKGMMVKGLKYQLKNKDVRNWLVENGFVETNRRIEAAAALKLQAA